MWRFVPLFLVACAPTPGFRVVSAEETGVVGRDASVAGRDGGPSATLWGRTVWTYGDTVTTVPDAEGSQWHTNSWDHADPSDWRQGLVTETDALGAPRYLIERSPEEVDWDARHAAEDCAEAPCHSRFALWPSQPLHDPETDRAWLLYGLFNDHHDSGVGLARWDGLDAPVVRERFGDSWLLFPAPEVEWATAPLVHDGHLYAFGCPLEFVARPCSLSRVALDAVADRGAWTFWDGRDWSGDVADAEVLFDGSTIMAVSYVDAIDRWWVVYAGPLSKEIRARSAKELTGPWSRDVVLYRVDGDSDPYDAQHHGDLAQDGGAKQFVTWSRPTGEGWFGAEHAVLEVVMARP